MFLSRPGVAPKASTSKCLAVSSSWIQTLQTSSLASLAAVLLSVTQMTLSPGVSRALGLPLFLAYIFPYYFYGVQCCSVTLGIKSRALCTPF